MAVFSTIGNIISSKSQSKAATKASQTVADTSAQNNELARDIYGQNKSALSPFMQSGIDAGGQINSMLGFGGTEDQNAAFDNFRNSSGYQFRLGQGMDSLNSGYAGAGLVQSGDAMRAATEYGQNFASNELGNYMGYLGNQQGVGLSGASALAGVGQNYANSVSANNNNAASAAANAALVKGANNPWASGLTNYGGALQNVAGMVIGGGF